MSLFLSVPRPASPGHSVFQFLRAMAVAVLSTCAPLLADGWTVHPTTGIGPSERSAPAVSALGKDVYLFGGVF